MCKKWVPQVLWSAELSNQSCVLKLICGLLVLVCVFVLRDITNMKGTIVAQVDSSESFQEFCSTGCLGAYENKQNPPKSSLKTKCTVCGKLTEVSANRRKAVVLKVFSPEQRLTFHLCVVPLRCVNRFDTRLALRPWLIRFAATPVSTFTAGPMAWSWTAASSVVTTCPADHQPTISCWLMANRSASVARTASGTSNRYFIHTLVFFFSTFI